ncbi:MAG: protein kinase [Deltaproteobacteria bacterium]|nr:protein kinase [Deltaproteobacteria bacterium]
MPDERAPLSTPALSGATPASADGAPSPAVEAAPAALAVAESSRYERRQVLGEGGMGRVVLARDRRLGRDVALKEVAPRGNDAAARHLGSRLAREAHVTAGLEHPGIVPVYDAGQSADGTPFYTMRVVRGRSLSDATRAAPDERARLSLLRHVLDATQAVAWAHAHGIVHRDLKPANIMVGEFGETQVVDWGLARPVREADGAEPASDGERVDAALTQLGSIVGTPQYLSPEQARGLPADPRCDVFALGLTLYEVATGRLARPTASADLALEQAVHGFALPGDVELPPELLAIITRATARTPTARYPDAKALAADLSAWLDGRRVSAHGYSAWELWLRVWRAWKAPILVGALALAAGATGIGLAFVEVQDERDRARAEETRATSAERRADGALSQAERDLGAALTAAAVAKAREGARADAELLAAQALVHTENPDARGILVAQGGSERPERLERWSLDGLIVGDHWIPTLDGRLGVSYSANRLAVWDLGGPAPESASAGPTRRPTLRWSQPMTIHNLGVDEARRVIWVTGILTAGDSEWDTASGSFDLDTGRLLERWETADLPFQTADSGVAVYATRIGEIVLMPDTPLSAIDLQGGCSGGSGTSDGVRIVHQCRSGQIRYRDAGGTTHDLLVDYLGLEPDGAIALVPGRELALIGGNKGQVLVVDLAEGRVDRIITGASGLVLKITVAPDGRFAAILDDGPGALVLDVATQSWVGRLPARDELGARFTTKPDELLTWGGSGMTRWRLQTTWPSPLQAEGGITSISEAGELMAVGEGREAVVRARGGGVLVRAAFSDVVKGVSAPDPLGAVRVGVIATPGLTRVGADGVRDGTWNSGVGGVRRVMDLGAGKVFLGLDWGGFRILDGALDTLWSSPDDYGTADAALAAGGHYAALIVNTERALVVVDLPRDSAPVVRRIGALDDFMACAISPDGMRVAGARDGVVEVFDDDGDLRASSQPVGQITELAWSGDGRWIAVGTKRGETWLLASDTLRLVARVADQNERVAALHFDASGRWLYSGSWDQTLRRRDLALLEAPATALTQRLEQEWGFGWSAGLRR